MEGASDIMALYAYMGCKTTVKMLYEVGGASDINRAMAEVARGGHTSCGCATDEALPK